MALQVARACYRASFAVYGLLAVFGWLPRACLLAVPAGWAVDRWIAAWEAEPGGGTEAHARGLVRRMLWVGALLIGGATAAYVSDIVSGGPVAGLAVGQK